MKKWIKRTGLSLLALVTLTLGVTFALFTSWRNQHIHDLSAQSVIAQTSRGPVEYAEVGQGKPILLVHGTPGGYDQLLGVIRATNKEGNGYRYIMPSRPGYLRTPLSVGKMPQQQAQAFAELLTKLGVDKVVVTATSGGGPLGLQFAMQYPERCAALILVETVTQRWTEPVAPQASIIQDYLIWLLGRFQVAQWQASNPADRDISVIGKLAISSIQPSALRIDGQANDNKQFAQIDNWPLDQIRCPTLILHGTADENVPIAHSEFVHSKIAGSQFVKFEGEDHYMVITKRKEIDNVIAGFLGEVVGAGP